MPPAGATRRRRPRGEIEPLPSGSLRVRVYAGIDPITAAALPPRGRPRRPDGRARGREGAARGCSARSTSAATRGPTRPSTSCSTATSSVLRDRGHHARRLRAHRPQLTSGPLLGHLPVGALDGETLDSFYAELRRCRDALRPPVRASTTAPRPSTSATSAAARTSASRSARRRSARSTSSSTAPSAAPCAGGGSAEPDRSRPSRPRAANAEPAAADARRRPRGSSTTAGPIPTGACSSGWR